AYRHLILNQYCSFGCAKSFYNSIRGPKSGPSGRLNGRFRSRDVLSASGRRRSTLLELSGMELHEVAHVRRYFAGELAHSVRHAVVTPLPGQLGHGREMPDDVFRKPRLTKAFAPRREWDVAISDGPAERLGEDARKVIQIGRFRPRQIVDLSNMRCGVVEDRRYCTRHINRRDRRGLAPAHRQPPFVGGPHARGGEWKKEAREENCRPHRYDRQSRPGQSLLRQPVQLVLRAVGGLADAHLRDRICEMFTKASTPWWRATAAVLTVASR